MADNTTPQDVTHIKKLVLKKITPDEKEKQKLWALFNHIKTLIEKHDSQHLIKRIELVGSVAKNTFLKGEGDLDIFMFFDTSLSKEDLEKYGLEIGKKVFEELRVKYVIKYAEHPYVKAKVQGIKVEIVPAYALDYIDKVVSAVDRTPFHKAYIQQHLRNHEEVLLLKKFMKACGVYGSELAVKGFSGYATELLIIKYGSFENVLKHALNWRIKEILCLNRCNKKKVLERFKDSVFIIVDPVDPNRNVTAVVSEKALMMFKICAYKFLKYPSSAYFEIKEVEWDAIKHYLDKLNRHYFMIKFKNVSEDIEDVIVPQLEKFKKLLEYEYEHYDFKVVRSFPYFCEKHYGLYFEFDSSTFSSYRVVKGPDVKANFKRIQGFLDKYQEIWVDDKGRLHANVKRHYALPEHLIREMKNYDFQQLRERGIPKNIAKAFHTLQI
ncbi:MAG: CCA tRNA nucleotidyltransferase, partial [Candidatus Nanohaloarchaeota archaeon]|nr:CCA tRNA nucleotidyltransferase [Candidatus Nanohaloarchaeota archaeon]